MASKSSSDAKKNESSCGVPPTGGITLDHPRYYSTGQSSHHPSDVPVFLSIEFLGNIVMTPAVWGSVSPKSNTLKTALSIFMKPFKNLKKFVKKDLENLRYFLLSAISMSLKFCEDPFLLSTKERIQKAVKKCSKQFQSKFAPKHFCEDFIAAMKKRNEIMERRFSDTGYRLSIMSMQQEYLQNLEKIVHDATDCDLKSFLLTQSDLSKLQEGFFRSLDAFKSSSDEVLKASSVLDHIQREINHQKEQMNQVVRIRLTSILYILPALDPSTDGTISTDTKKIKGKSKTQSSNSSKSTKSSSSNSSLESKDTTKNSASITSSNISSSTNSTPRTTTTASAPSSSPSQSTKNIHLTLVSVPVSWNISDKPTTTTRLQTVTLSGIPSASLAKPKSSLTTTAQPKTSSILTTSTLEPKTTTALINQSFASITEDFGLQENDEFYMSLSDAQKQQLRHLASDSSSLHFNRTSKLDLWLSVLCLALLSILLY